MADGSKDSVVAPAPDKVVSGVKAPSPDAKVVEVRENGDHVIQIEDGRMFPAEVKDGVQVRKGTKVEFTSDPDTGNGPQGAVITKAL